MQPHWGAADGTAAKTGQPVLVTKGIVKKNSHIVTVQPPGAG